MRDESRIRKILPVNLMLEGRPCLVVGSGQIAARKVGHLLEAGASVTVVGPEAVGEIHRWAEAGFIQYQARPFRKSDLQGQWVVLAATDNLKVNGAVIRLCRQRGVLCSAADAHWTEADFMIPATLRQAQLTLTISTGGESCRRARLIKDYLARHLDILRSADLRVVSIKRPRRTASNRVMELGEVLQQIWGIHEFMILNRPDRLDVLAVVSDQTAVAAKLLRDCVRLRFPGKCGLHEGASAVEYVVHSLASVDPTYCVSMQANGDESTSAALRDSTQAGWAGVMMKEWVEASLRLAGELRKNRSQALKSGLRKPSKEYQRQYEIILRSV